MYLVCASGPTEHAAVDDSPREVALRDRQCSRPLRTSSTFRRCDGDGQDQAQKSAQHQPELELAVRVLRAFVSAVIAIPLGASRA